MGRLAPSPTGGLHVGHARTFLAAWLCARSRGGRVILRIEDLDATRVREEAVQGAIDDLHWLGLDWDEGPDIGGPGAPYVQSQRFDLYARSMDRLKAAEAVYPCVCTRADIARAASAPHAEDEGLTYPGTCSVRCAGDAATLRNRSFGWRFRVPGHGVAWHDLIRGELEGHPARSGGDFLVAREGLGPGYQLAVVHDDAAMGVTQVIRGDDLIPSTPRQILLYEALGWQGPVFGHVPVVHGPDGRRLAKRDGSIKLGRLREAGLDPRSLVGWLAHTLGQAAGIEPSDPHAWCSRFDPTRIPAEPLVLRDWDLDTLRHGWVPPV
ncbi:MAG: tRNA glutamyl-Q(34) synthetase GluQRS [Isosphaeraceae bacterium]